MNNQYGDLTLTTEQIQARLDLVPEHSQAITALQQAITAFVTSEQVQTLIGSALADYSTTSDMNTAINNAIASALTSYYTKTAIDTLLGNKVDKVSGKQLSTNDFTTALKNKLDGLPDSSALATQISEAISTALQSYSTTSAMNTAISNAISTALTSYYTKAQMDTIITGITSNILFLNRALGKYDTVTERTLVQATAGKYVNVNGQEVSASGYGISEPMAINAGDILLVPSAQAVPADVSVVARKVTRTYDAAVVVGFARAIVIIAQDGQIIDTILYNLSNFIGQLPSLVAGYVMFFVQMFINFFISSGSGQAALTMPIMAPLGELVGITPQTSILIFQFGDGFSNAIFPTSAVLMACLGVAGIPWAKWIKWVWPVQLIFGGLAIIFITIAILMGWS